MGKTTTTASIGYLLLSLGLTASCSLRAIWQGEPPVTNLHQEDEFFAACQENNLPAVTHYLTVEGVDVNKAYRKAQIEPGTTEAPITVTALQQAVILGHDQIVDALMQAGADVDQTTPSHGSPLLLACQNNNETIINLLLAAQADPNKASSHGYTPLFQASYNGNVRVARLLLEAKAEPNVTEHSGATPLFVASQNNHDEIVSLLLTAGANLNMATNDGATPLFMASQQGHSTIVSLLLNARADPNITNKQGVTPLLIASQGGHAKTVSLLLINTRANPNIASKNGVTPLCMASYWGNDKIVRLLLGAGADTRITARGHTPLLIASQYGYKTIVNLLLDARADPNQARDDGLTPLLLVSWEGKDEIVRLLLDYGADPELGLLKGCCLPRTPLTCARHKKFLTTRPGSEKRKTYNNIITMLSKARAHRPKNSVRSSPTGDIPLGPMGQLSIADQPEKRSTGAVITWPELQYQTIQQSKTTL